MMVFAPIAAVVLSLAARAVGQGQTHNLTPDGYWHNRYHAILSMAAYGDYNTLCPNQTFNEETLRRNFPDSTRPPWDVVSTFGPTPSGCEGFTAIVPEMNKALIVFKGNYELEQTLPMDVIDWESTLNISQYACPNCTANRFAMQGYLECKNETNNWAAIREAYAGQGLVFSITGHGLGGMHSLIASIDLNQQNVSYYSHNYGTPRTFNLPGSLHYNYYFNGEAGERGIAGNDLYTEYIPAGPDYAHAGTQFYYSGYNVTASGMNWNICWSGVDEGPIVDDPACAPRPQENSTAEQDHYFYFSAVGQCGGDFRINTTLIDAFLADPQAAEDTLQSSLSSQSSASMASVSSVAAASSLSVSSASAASVSSASVASAEAATAVSTSAQATSTVTGGAAAQLVNFSFAAVLVAGLGLLLC